MNSKPGDLVGIPLPYTDLTAKKRRPVLVVTNPDGRGDFMGLAITSVITKDLAVSIDEESMLTGRLPRKSYIRYDKIFTLNNAIIVKTYGSIKQNVLQKVMKNLCDYLGCD